MTEGESFEDFKNSFSYGSRSDLSFKFLKALQPEEAAEFIGHILREVGNLYDDPTSERLIDLVYDWQVKAYQPGPGAKRHYVYDDRPFQGLARPLGDATVALVTSSGHYIADDPPPHDPDHMTQDEAMSRIDEFMRRPPHLSEIPVDVPADDLRVRHPGYDIRSARHDSEVTLPLSSLRDAERQGRIGRLAPTAYSFVGACSQGRLRQELDGWVERWKSAGAEALFLVPV
jgi:D-proline reductase (dithiol) PrdB